MEEERDSDKISIKIMYFLQIKIVQEKFFFKGTNSVIMIESKRIL